MIRSRHAYILKVKNNKYNFSGACTYLASEFSRIFTKKDPESQIFKYNGYSKGGRNVNRRIYVAWINHSNKNNYHGKKDNGG